MQAAQPSAETCNGVDDDCDGVIDNDDPGGGNPCLTGLPGACGLGTLGRQPVFLLQTLLLQFAVALLLKAARTLDKGGRRHGRLDSFRGRRG